MFEGYAWLVWAEIQVGTRFFKAAAGQCERDTRSVWVMLGARYFCLYCENHIFCLLNPDGSVYTIVLLLHYLNCNIWPIRLREVQTMVSPQHKTIFTQISIQVLINVSAYFGLITASSVYNCTPQNRYHQFLVADSYAKLIQLLLHMIGSDFKADSVPCNSPQCIARARIWFSASCGSFRAVCLPHKYLHIHHFYKYARCIQTW